MCVQTARISCWSSHIFIVLAVCRKGNPAWSNPPCPDMAEGPLFLKLPQKQNNSAVTATTARAEQRMEDCFLFTSLLNQVVRLKQALEAVGAYQLGVALKQMASAHTAQYRYP